MLFCSPRGRLQLPFLTPADMASESIRWIIQTKTVILQEQAESWARKSKSVEQVTGPRERPSVACQRLFLLKACVQNQEWSNALDKSYPSKFSVLHKTSTGSREKGWWAHAGISLAVTLPWYSFLSCGLKIILGLSFSCPHTCCNYSLLLRSLLGVSRDPRKALPALYCTSVQNT